MDRIIKGKRNMYQQSSQKRVSFIYNIAADFTNPRFMLILKPAYIFGV
jgi:hypothetical protein